MRPSPWKPLRFYSLKELDEELFRRGEITTCVYGGYCLWSEQRCKKGFHSPYCERQRRIAQGKACPRCGLRWERCICKSKALNTSPKPILLRWER
jgi:hypothetical protein